jgi:hypothetical protein
LICGSGYGYSRERAASTIISGWHLDLVHPSKHIYAKMALKLLEKLAPQDKPAAAATAAQGDTNRKRTWSASNQSDAGSSVSGKRTGSIGRHSGGNGGGGGTGSGGRPTPRSSSWREHKDSRRFNEGGYGRQGQQHSYFGHNDWDSSYADPSRGRSGYHGGRRGRRN